MVGAGVHTIFASALIVAEPFSENDVLVAVTVAPDGDPSIASTSSLPAVVEMVELLAVTWSGVPGSAWNEDPAATVSVVLGAVTEHPTSPVTVKLARSSSLIVDPSQWEVTETDGQLLGFTTDATGVTEVGPVTVIVAVAA
jgi:hypothetical protein